ncbi:MAG: matrixin family metalloprotease [Planctomycetota bacterium]
MHVLTLRSTRSARAAGALLAGLLGTVLAAAGGIASPLAAQADHAMGGARPVTLPAALPMALPDGYLLAAPRAELLRREHRLDGTLADIYAIDIEPYRGLSPLHQSMVRWLAANRIGRLRACWLQPPTPAAAAFFNAVMRGPQGFQPGNRWTTTATNGGGLNQGDPTTITYSFMPDGTFLPNAIGEGSAPSSLFASFNAAFPSQATWQNRIHAMFDRWSELTGIDYVFEPNDDGAPGYQTGGVIGVRGDVRIGGKFIDGGSNTLAFNIFPNGGEMIFDTADTNFYAFPANNYARLFNVAAHEAGHGMGIEHVCPVNQSKLMEPIATTAFSGPQFDDILTAQFLYGDPLEPNNSLATATDLGTFANGTSDTTNVSIHRSTDSDYYRFSFAGDKLLTVSLVPTGMPYLEGPEINGSCTSGSLLDPRNNLNLSMLLLNGSGIGVLASASAQPAGQSEVIPSLALAAGNYVLRVAGGGSGNTIQTYRLQWQVVDNGDIGAATQVGTGCGGVTWTPINRPLLGGTMVLALGNIPNPAASIGLVLLGESEVPGGIDLSAFGAPGCFAYQNTLDIVTLFPLTGPTRIYTLPIPSTPALSGSTVWTQGGLVVPPGTNLLNVLTANAVELFLGTQ